MGALRIERDDDVLRVTLARPETRNAFDADLIAELAEAFVDVGKARAVLLAGDGPSFCAGADVEWMRASVDLDFDANVADANALRGMLEAIDRCPAPVVARIQGHALGGGAGPRRVRGHRGRGAEGGVRLLRGEARDHPRRDLPVRAREDRAELGSPLLRHRRALRRRDGAPDRARARGRPDLDAAVERVLAELRERRPAGARHAKRLVLERPDGPGDGAADRRAPHERRGPGGPARLPRAAFARLGLAASLTRLDGDAPPPSASRAGSSSSAAA